MRLVFQATIAAILAAAPAARAGYTLKQVKVHGKPALSVSAISPGGIIGGTYQNAFGLKLGFLLAGGTLKTLKQDTYFDPPIPTGINDKGMVGGIAYQGDQVIAFVWKHGRYEQTFVIAEGTQSDRPYIVSINASGTVAFNDHSSGENVPYFGKSAPFQEIPVYDFAFVQSINRSSVTAGDMVTYQGGRVFTYANGNATMLPDPMQTTALPAALSTITAPLPAATTGHKIIRFMVLFSRTANTRPSRHLSR